MRCLSALPSMPDRFLVLAKPPLVASPRLKPIGRRAAASASRCTGRSWRQCAAAILLISGAGVCNVFEEALNSPEVQQIRSVMRSFAPRLCGCDRAAVRRSGIFTDKAYRLKRCAEREHRAEKIIALVRRPSAHGPLRMRGKICRNMVY